MGISPTAIRPPWQAHAPTHAAAPTPTAPRPIKWPRRRAPASARMQTRRIARSPPDRAGAPASARLGAAGARCPVAHECPPALDPGKRPSEAARTQRLAVHAAQHLQRARRLPAAVARGQQRVVAACAGRHARRAHCREHRPRLLPARPDLSCSMAHARHAAARAARLPLPALAQGRSLLQTRRMR